MTENEAAGCEGKKEFTSATLAWRAACRQPGREAYRCNACGLWHVGRINLMPKRKPRRKRRVHV